MSTATLVAPKVLQVPPGRVGSFVDDVGEIAERLGSPLVPEQVLAVEALTSYDRRGRWLSVEAGVELPRQNGKTKGIVQPVMLWSMVGAPRSGGAASAVSRKSAGASTKRPQTA